MPNAGNIVLVLFFVVVSYNNCPKKTKMSRLNWESSGMTQSVLSTVFFLPPCFESQSAGNIA